MEVSLTHLALPGSKSIIKLPIIATLLYTSTKALNTFLKDHLFNMYECYHIHAVPEEARRGHQTSGLSPRGIWELNSFPRAARALNC